MGNMWDEEAGVSADLATVPQLISPERTLSLGPLPSFLPDPG